MKKIVHKKELLLAFFGGGSSLLLILESVGYILLFLFLNDRTEFQDLLIAPYEAGIWSLDTMNRWLENGGLKQFAQILILMLIIAGILRCISRLVHISRKTEKYIPCISIVMKGLTSILSMPFILFCILNDGGYSAEAIMIMIVLQLSMGWISNNLLYGCAIIRRASREILKACRDVQE